MSFLEIFLLALALSMDAFAVSLCKGLNMTGKNLNTGIIIAAFFGFFQGFMPLIGWFLGQQFEEYIVAFDHWIAFILLGFIGGKMLYEGIKGEPDLMCEYRVNYKELFFLAIATSIDALAVGITLAFLNVSIIFSASVIAVTTFIISFIGVVLGKRFGVLTKNYAEIAGGLILIFIGTKILIEHLGIF